jgi:tetratricopeptide (TPR) repeat protein
MMRLCLILACTAAAMSAADEQRLALTLQAQSQFERVERSAPPDLGDSIACTQTQAALLPVALPEELALVHYRKGVCMLAAAAITHNAAEFTDAAAEFDKAIEAWPARARNGGKKIPPEPLPSGVRLLGAIARLETGGRPTPSLDPPVCSPALMSAGFCTALTETARQWLGWLALEVGALAEAARDFSGSPATGWSEWVAGRQAFLAGRYQEAAGDYRQAVDLARHGPPPSPLGRLAPQPDVPSELIELGGAQLLAGDAPAAIATLDEAVKAAPESARALFLRARARETAGQTEAAIGDYNLASRTAFAKAADLASGEAHLYRGILLYRRKDYSHAEDEFSSALNFEIPGGLRPDAVAWRHLAAVAAGSCDASRQYLERSLAAASPYFPRAEARSLMALCYSAE